MNKQPRISMDRIIHEHRNTESWIIKETNTTPADIENRLVGAHLNVHDYFGVFPYLIFPIEFKPMKGKIFTDVYWINAEETPLENRCFLANGHFLRNCLPIEVKTEEKSKQRVHSLDGLQLIFSSPDAHDQLFDIEKNYNCFIIGVRGNSDTHFDRGMTNVPEKSTETQ